MPLIWKLLSDLARSRPGPAPSPAAARSAKRSFSLSGPALLSCWSLAWDIRLVEPDTNIDPGHAAAGEGQGVDKPAQRRAPPGLRLRRIVSAIQRDWLPPLVGRD